MKPDSRGERSLAVTVIVVSLTLGLVGVLIFAAGCSTGPAAQSTTSAQALASTSPPTTTIATTVTTAELGLANKDFSIPPIENDQDITIAYEALADRINSVYGICMSDKVYKEYAASRQLPVDFIDKFVKTDKEYRSAIAQFLDLEAPGVESAFDNEMAPLMNYFLLSSESKAAGSLNQVFKCNCAFGQMISDFGPGDHSFSLRRTSNVDYTEFGYETDVIAPSDSETVEASLYDTNGGASGGRIMVQKLVIQRDATGTAKN